MIEWVRRFLWEFPLFVLIAICTYLVMSSSQTLFHYALANGNFAVIDFFWDRLLGTYRSPDKDVR